MISGVMSGIPSSVGLNCLTKASSLADGRFEASHQDYNLLGKFTASDLSIVCILVGDID